MKPRRGDDWSEVILHSDINDYEDEIETKRSRGIKTEKLELPGKPDVYVFRLNSKQRVFCTIDEDNHLVLYALKVTDHDYKVITNKLAEKLTNEVMKQQTDKLVGKLVDKMMEKLKSDVKTKQTASFKKNIVDSIINKNNNVDTLVEYSLSEYEIILLKKKRVKNISDFLQSLDEVASKIKEDWNKATIKTELRNLITKILSCSNELKEINPQVEELVNKLNEENNQPTNDTKPNNDNLKEIQVNEPQASIYNDNSSSTPDLSTGAIPEKRTHIALGQSSSIQNETSTKRNDKTNQKLIDEFHKKLKTNNDDEIYNYLNQNKEIINEENKKELLTLSKTLSKKIFPKDNNCDARHYIAKINLIETAKLLIKHGVKFYDKGDIGLTPLRLALMCGHVEMAELLIRKGNAKVDVKYDNGSTPLLYAAMCGYETLVKLIIKIIKNSEGIRATINGLTALHYAAQCWHTGIAKLLIDQKVDVDAKDNNNLTPLCHVFAVIKVNVNRKGKVIEVVKLLLDNGSNVNTIDSKGVILLCNVLSTSSTRNELDNKEVVKLLLKYGADVNYTHSDGTTILDIAIKYCPTNIQKIIQAKSKIDNEFFEAVKSFYKNQILKLSTDEELAKITNLLETKDRNGFQPGFYSTFERRTANKQIVDKQTVIDLVTSCKNKELLQVLLDHAVKIRQTKLIEYLLDIKDPNEKPLVDSKHVQTLLDGLKNDEQETDAEPTQKIIELLNTVKEQLLQTNTLESDNNLKSKNSDTDYSMNDGIECVRLADMSTNKGFISGENYASKTQQSLLDKNTRESKVSFDGITQYYQDQYSEDSNNTVEYSMNIDNELANIQLLGSNDIVGY